GAGLLRRLPPAGGDSCDGRAHGRLTNSAGRRQRGCVMFADFDPVILARLQFAFTMSFHIVFPAFTIGLASYLAVLEALWLWTGRAVYENLFKYWVRVFAVAFGMGVVS